jgi:hypothetical protein
MLHGFNGSFGGGPRAARRTSGRHFLALSVDETDVPGLHAGRLKETRKASILLMHPCPSSLSQSLAEVILRMVIRIKFNRCSYVPVFSVEMKKYQSEETVLLS